MFLIEFFESAKLNLYLTVCFAIKKKRKGTNQSIGGNYTTASKG